MTYRTLSLSGFLALAKAYPEATAAVTCGILLLSGWLALHLSWIGIALLILPAAYVIGGYETAKEGLTTLWQEKELDVDLLMIVAALGAASLGLWQRQYYLIVDGAALILIFAISGAMEHVAMQRTDRNIRRLMSMTPDTARIIEGDRDREIAIERLQVGDLVLVKPGEFIPTDSTIIEGNSIVNQAPITGESVPVEKTAGDEVFAGTLNGDGALKLKVHQPPESSLIQRVIRLVEQAQNEAPPSQLFIERFERGYAKAIVAAGLLLASLPPFLLNWSWQTTIYKALIFLVVASPCALMASIMPTLLSGIANGARAGILFKDGAQLEKIGRVRAIAFDKTGTLTTGQLQVVEIISAANSTEEELLQLAAALESCSPHPIAQAIVRAAGDRNLEWQVATDVQIQTGRGITGRVDSDYSLVGKAAFVSSKIANNNPQLTTESDRLESLGNTVIWVARSERVLGLIAVADSVRSEAKEMVRRLKKLGIETIVMLTGDNERTARSVGQSLDIEQVYAELLPEDKLTVIRQLQQRYQTVAMVGDGINDAPALAQASVGIAMGKIGSDVALETADIVLMTDSLEKLVRAIRLGRRANRIIQENIFVALGSLVLLLIANFAGSINLPLGVIGHEGSTVLVTLNGLKLLKN